MANWIPSAELTDADLLDIQKLQGRSSEGVMKTLLLSEKSVNRILRDSKDVEQIYRAQGIAQFLEELSGLIMLDK